MDRPDRPAFPVTNLPIAGGEFSSPGMTIREVYAAQFAAAMLVGGFVSRDLIARGAIEMADDLIAELDASRAKGA
jgi:hypothetical protein